MPNQNGSVFGLTFLCPILDDETLQISHDLQIRDYLASLPTDQRSPFALAPNTHVARLAVMDDVIYVGMPACEEHLASKYLVFETNTDADLPDYLRALADAVPQHIDAIWSHCTGYPGTADFGKLLDYMKACQIPTTFFFAAVNDRTVPQTLLALQAQHAVAEFIVTHQGMSPAQLQQEFLSFYQALQSLPCPAPGGKLPRRVIKTGGHNE
jgi:hypothetical protein